jgi:hypothetical protein
VVEYLRTAQPTETDDEEEDDSDDDDGGGDALGALHRTAAQLACDTAASAGCAPCSLRASLAPTQSWPRVRPASGTEEI